MSDQVLVALLTCLLQVLVLLEAVGSSVRNKVTKVQEYLITDTLRKWGSYKKLHNCGELLCLIQNSGKSKKYSGDEILWTQLHFKGYHKVLANLFMGNESLVTRISVSLLWIFCSGDRSMLVPCLVEEPLYLQITDMQKPRRVVTILNPLRLCRQITEYKNYFYSKFLLNLIHLINESRLFT